MHGKQALYKYSINKFFFYFSINTCVQSSKHFIKVIWVIPTFLSFACNSHLATFFCLRRLDPIWRSTFTFSAAFPTLILLSSSRNPMSSTQCRLFPTPQCALLHFPYSSAPIPLWLYMEYEMVIVVTPFSVTVDTHAPVPLSSFHSG